MEILTFANSIGILDILIGLPLLLYPKQSRKWLDHLCKEEQLIRIIGALMAMYAGGILLGGYYVDLTPVGLLQLVAWLVFLKGLTWAWFPGFVQQMKKKWLKSDTILTISGLAATAIGSLLVYAGSVM